MEKSGTEAVRGSLGEDSVFQIFCLPLLKAIQDRGFVSPTDPQMKLVPIVAAGKNALLMAPTGTGKTEAAVLPILDVIIREGLSRSRGTKLLYVTPLRALNRDMLERMRWWCKRFDIRLGVRHGDTPASERTGQSMAPPDILITTPETLQAMLTGRRIRESLLSLRWVVIDEVHELAEDKRGSQLTVALERLRRIVGREFQTIGLSATVGSPEVIAQFLVGKANECEVVRVPVEKSLEFSVARPQAGTEDRALAESIFTYPEVAARLRLIRQVVERYHSVLIFTNTRTEAEALANRFRVWNSNLPIGIHHSSLSRATREAVERDLRDGRLSGVISTSSLELGIDIGFLEFVIQYNSPRQVSRLIQRIGRSGHKVGQTSRGMIITQDSDDTLEAMVLCRRALGGELEPLVPFKVPYDAAIHQIAGLLIETNSWKLEDLYSIIRRAYSYSTMSIETLKMLLGYMSERYPRLLHFLEGESLVKRARDVKPLFEYYFDNLSMIPDEKQYVVVAEGDRMVGVLDEAFISEYGDVGVKFVEAGRCWKIQEIYQNRVYVSPEEDPTGAVPSWIGDEIPVPLEVALEVGALRREYLESVKQSREEEFLRQLSERYPIQPEIAREAFKEVLEQDALSMPIPSDNLVTVERWDRYIVYQASFGHKVNRVLARVIAHLLSERIGQSVAVHQDPYRIILEAEISAEIAMSTLLDLVGKDIRKLARAAVERSGIFKRRLIHAGKKCGAIAKNADYASVSLSGLIEALRGTPVFEEAINVIFHDDFDVEATEAIVSKIGRKEILVEMIDSDTLSPLAKIGVEEVSRRGEIISPERLRALIRQSTEVRINDTFLAAACTACWDYVELRKVTEIQALAKCPKCQKESIGFSTETYEEVFGVAMKARSRTTIHGKSLKLAEALRRTSDQRREYGHDFVMLLAGRGIRTAEAAALAAKKKKEGGNIVDYIIDGEREALRRRYFAQ
jgi:ATP-dependent Lhr-like helicase